MGPTLPPDNEVWDLDRLGLPAEMVGDVSTRRRPPRHRSGHPFIKGPSSGVFASSVPTFALSGQAAAPDEK